MFQRYIENELQQENFLNFKDYVQLKEEILLYVHFGGHGCIETEQIFVLNEEDMEKKAFWKAEKKLIDLAKKCGNGLKIFVVFDTCREDKKRTEASMLKSRAAQAKVQGDSKNKNVQDKKQAS